MPYRGVEPILGNSGNLQQGTGPNGRAFKADFGADASRPSISGPAIPPGSKGGARGIGGSIVGAENDDYEDPEPQPPATEDDPIPPPPPRPAPRPMTPEEMMHAADMLTNYFQTQQAGMMAQGPSVQPEGPPAWLQQYMSQAPTTGTYIDNGQTSQYLTDREKLRYLKGLK